MLDDDGVSKKTPLLPSIDASLQSMHERRRVVKLIYNFFFVTGVRRRPRPWRCDAAMLLLTPDSKLSFLKPRDL